MACPILVSARSHRGDMELTHTAFWKKFIGMSEYKYNCIQIWFKLHAQNNVTNQSICGYSSHKLDDDKESNYDIHRHIKLVISIITTLCSHMRSTTTQRPVIFLSYSQNQNLKLLWVVFPLLMFRNICRWASPPLPSTSLYISIITRANPKTM